MKKYISVFSLFVRSSIYKIIPLFLATGAVQFIMFYRKLNTLLQWDNTSLGIEPILEEGKLALIACIAMIVAAVILSRIGCEYSSKTGYSIRRLNVSERKVLVCQGAFNCLVYTVFIMFEFILSLIIFQFYCKEMSDVNLAHPGFISNQTFFLAFYRSDFLHSLLPLSDYLRFIRNALYIVSLGFSLAAFPYLQRRKKICFEAIFLTLFVALTFFDNWEEVGTEIFYICVALCITAFAVYRIKTKGADYEN